MDDFYDTLETCAIEECAHEFETTAHDIICIKCGQKFNNSEMTSNVTFSVTLPREIAALTEFAEFHDDAIAILNHFNSKHLVAARSQNRKIYVRAFIYLASIRAKKIIPFHKILDDTAPGDEIATSLSKVGFVKTVCQIIEVNEIEAEIVANIAQTISTNGMFEQMVIDISKIVTNIPCIYKPFVVHSILKFLILDTLDIVAMTELFGMAANSARAMLFGKDMSNCNKLIYNYIIGQLKLGDSFKI